MRTRIIWAASFVGWWVVGAGTRARAQTMELVGSQGSNPSISADGRYVAFESTQPLVAGDTNGSPDIFVYDRSTGGTVRVSVSSAGAQSLNFCSLASISATGRFVVFESQSTNLVAGGTNGSLHLFRHDRDADGDGTFDEPGAIATILVTVNTAGQQANANSREFGRCVSADGNIVVFESDATNLVPGGDSNLSGDVLARNISAGTTALVSSTSAGVQANGPSLIATVSGNGMFVAFGSNASNLDRGGVVSSHQDIFLKNLATGATTWISVGLSGAVGNGFGDIGPHLSDDGRFVAFYSSSTNLVTPDANGFTGDVFVRDTVAGTTTLATVSSTGVQSDADCDPPAISGDGRIVAFRSFASNLIQASVNGVPQAYAHDRVTGVTVCVSRSVAGAPGDGDSGYLWPAVSGDGSVIAFGSAAMNLGPADPNFGVYVRGGAFLGPGGGGGAPVCEGNMPYDPMPDDDPVTFSVNGPVDPHTEGIRDPRGVFPPTPPAGPQPGNPIALGIRVGPAAPPVGPVTQAVGLPTIWPGDVMDYDVAGVPSEAVMFQSPPFPPALPVAAPPDGTNNQILEAMAMGLAAGLGVPPPAWMAVVPMRDNVDAFSFGQDYFPPIEAGYAPAFLPPPMAPIGTAWEARMSVYAEPIVSDDAPGISFRFSVDPWAVGAAGTAVAVESLGADAGAGMGPWTSGGEAAGDVFGTPVLLRVAGVTVAGGVNVVVDDEATLGLSLDTPATPMEDDLDGLECVGDNFVPWFPGGLPDRPGDLNARVAPPGAPPAPPGISVRDPLNDAPSFFSVTRSSPGVPFTAVRTQFVIGGGAAADIYVAVKDPADPAGVGMNLLFIDNFELGLMPTDDLDGLILWVRPDVRPLISSTIDTILMTMPWTGGTDGALSGPGMTLSITKYLGTAIPAGSICVGFSVTTDSIGLEYTAVDFEAGPVFPPLGFSSASGDIFYANVDGTPFNTNYLWYEEVDLGLDPGARVNGAALPAGPPAVAGLAVLSDNVDALDSINVATSMPVGPPSASLALSSTAFAVGQTLEVNASVIGGTTSRRVDVRFSLGVPRGSKVTILTRSNVLLPAGASRTARVFRRTFQGNEPRGRYDAILRLADHATGTVLTEVRRPFDFP